MRTTISLDDRIFEALCAGATGYLLKKTSPVRLLESLRECVAGGAPMSPEVIERFRMEFGSPWAHTGLGDLELVELNEGLGRYFGTDKGLLVVKAPKSDAFDLKDGDVIHDIDGREPKDVRHALRILGSYAAGEKLKLGIMRDKKKRTVDIEIPADFHGNVVPQPEFDVRPARAPAEPLPPVVVPLPDDDVATIIVDVSS